jgi:hypothetical protein
VGAESESVNLFDYLLRTATSQQPAVPNWGVVNTRANGADANYQAAQMEFSHRYTAGLGFDSSYTFAKNLADNQGYTPGGFAGENAGGRTMDALDLKHEYGPVYASRKNRWLTTAFMNCRWARDGSTCLMPTG